MDSYFDADAKGYSSGHRELMAVKLALETNETFFSTKAESIVYWATDSQNNFIFLKRGSKKQHIQRTAFEVKCLELEYNITIFPVWIERESKIIQLADEGTKLHLSTDEWGMIILN